MAVEAGASPERTPVEERAVLLTVMEALNTALSGRPADAIRMLSASRLVLSHYAGANNLGSLLIQSGDAPGALKAFDRALELKPDYADAWCNRGVALQRLGRKTEALTAFDEAIRLAGGNVMAHLNRGNVLASFGAFAEAAAAFDRATLLDPRLFQAHLNRALVAANMGDAEQALRSFDAALSVRPDSREAFEGRQAMLRHLGRAQEAAEMRAPAPNDGSQAVAEAAAARGKALIELDRAAEALALLARVPAKGAGGARVAIVRSAALWKSGRAAEALAAVREAVRLDPYDPDVHEEYAYLCLKMGDLAHGWEEYEYRLEKPPGRMRRADFQAPVWQGEDLAGKRIVVSPEQGHGDTIQFARYVPLLAARSAAATAVVQKPLLNLMRSMRAPVAWADAFPAAETFDYQVPLMSLAHRFGTRLENVPADVPYLFADADAVGKWRTRIRTGGLRVGIIWQGNPDYAADPARSIPLAHFAPLAAVPGVRLISLQAQRGLGQLQRLPPGMKVETFGPEITDNPDGLREIAAVIATLDLVVASDTAVAHLAGALGAPVWVALAHDADWRWMAGREDSPWYPTMRLFRQKSAGDWPGVFAAISTALRGLVA
jgi:tetratricopeptide (TPR) repeat protein